MNEEYIKIIERQMFKAKGYDGTDIRRLMDMMIAMKKLGFIRNVMPLINDQGMYVDTRPPPGVKL